MEIVKQLPISRYIAFYNKVYMNIPNFKDTSTALIEMICNKSGPFAKHASVLPIAVIENNEITAVAILITTPRYPGILQAAFFEALKDNFDAVNFMFSYIKEYAKTKGLNKITIGLNGHVNYSLGMLSSHFNDDVAFGSTFTPEYYIDYFRKLGFREYELLSFLMEMEKYNLDKEKRLLERIGKNYTIREADFSNFRREVEIYTYLNNACFKNHMFYYERDVEEDYELLKQLKYFIKGKSFLIAEAQGEPIGFMLWYPDFNQLVANGKGAGVKTAIKNKLFPGRIRRFKLAEIGVLPQYHGTGAILGLFHRCMELVKGKYDECESSWILFENQKSKGFGYRWGAEEYKHFKVFEVSL